MTAILKNKEKEEQQMKHEHREEQEINLDSCWLLLLIPVSQDRRASAAAGSSLIPKR